MFHTTSSATTGVALSLTSSEGPRLRAARPRRNGKDERSLLPNAQPSENSQEITQQQKDVKPEEVKRRVCHLLHTNFAILLQKDHLVILRKLTCTCSHGHLFTSVGLKKFGQARNGYELGNGQKEAVFHFEEPEKYID
ncbi:hypothetical protein Nepgr_003795 [Nepenthes gracilis]|uniref:Uncharacterized protein n=1 Tax=Nepenthes gracilis TaxID=150966 RepID=A0AAD3S081_NEPGR|nr:hypothetical protein Nepgr_003795 [Nepenthes gracilis]